MKKLDLRISRWQYVSVVGGILIIAIVGFLLYSNYRSQTALQKETVVRMEATLHGWVASINGYLRERERNIIDLADSAVVESYFINRALGMSLQYGLRESLNIIEHQFSNLVSNQQYSFTSTFAVLCLYDINGTVLASAVRKGIDPAEMVFPVTSDPLNKKSVVRPFKHPDINDSFLQICVPVSHNHERSGTLVALISLSELYTRFFPRQIGTVTNDYLDFIVMAGGSEVLFAPETAGISETGLTALIGRNENQISHDRAMYTIVNGKQVEVEVIGHQHDENTIRLFWVMDTRLIKSPTNITLLIVLISGLATVIMSSIFFATRQVAQSSMLRARLDESSRKEQEILYHVNLLQEEIDQRQIVETQLQQKQVLLHSLLDSIPDMIFYKSTKLSYTGCNLAFANFVGKPFQEIVGRQDTDLFDQEYKQIFSRFDSSVISFRKQSRYEVSFPREGGETVYLEIIKTPYFSPENAVIGLIGICRDITERKAIEEELKQQEERLSLVIHATDVGVWDWDITSGKTFFNERWANIVGYSLAELRPLSVDTWMELTHPDDLAQAEALLKQHFNKDTADYDCELRMKHKNGHWVWIHDRGRVVDWAEDGSPLRMTGTHADITRRKIAEMDLQQLNETLEQRVEERSKELNQALSSMLTQEKLASIGQLAAGIAHELNNPINFVRVNFVTLQEYFSSLVQWHKACHEALQKTEPEKAALVHNEVLEVEKKFRLAFLLDDIPSLFQETQQGFERVADIIGAMRNFSRQEARDKFGPVDINRCINDTLIISRNEYKYVADIDLQLGEVPVVEAIAQQLNQVLLNLIVNAAHAIIAAQKQTNGVITIKTWQEGETVFSSIQDNGAGIAMEHMSHMFEPFFTTKPPGKGTGLGLSISYDIITNKHGGMLSCESVEGEGACFTISLPIRQPGNAEQGSQ